MNRWHFSVLLTIALAGRALADGGALQFSRVSQGIQVSVFTSPGVPAAGLVELNVLVQNASTHSAVLDADVAATLVPPNGNRPGSSAWAPPICAAASSPDLQDIQLNRSGVQNLLCYGATIQIPHGGNWKLALRVARAGQVDLIEGELRVADQVAPWTSYWHLFLLPIVAVAGFVVVPRRQQRDTLVGNKVRPRSGGSS
ncbi:MAG TPA: hypothetical protein VGD78_23555 [Chthoniobacterales bacterium]